MPDAPAPDPQPHIQPTADVLDTLDAALDALVLGTPPSVLAEFALDADLTLAIDDLWARASRTGPPAPDAAFVASLREELIAMTPAKPTIVPPSRRSLHVVSPFPRFPRVNSLFGALSTAAAIVLVVVLVLASFTGGRGGDILNGLGLTSKQEPAPQAIMWGGDPGHTWNLGGESPDPNASPNALIAPGTTGSWMVTSDLIVGDRLIRTMEAVSPSYVTDPPAQNIPAVISSVDLATGQENWTIDAKAWGTMASDGTNLYVYTLDPTSVTYLKPRLTVYSLATGAQVRIGPELQQLSHAATAYGPILLNGTLYASDALGDVVAVDPASGERRWQYPDALFPAVSASVSSATPSSSMIGIGDAIYVTTASKTLVKLDAKTGKQLASANLTDRYGADLRSVTLTAVDGDVLLRLSRDPVAGADNGQGATDQRSTLVRLSATDLVTMWSKNLGDIESNLVVTSDVILLSGFASLSGSATKPSLVAFDASTGDQLDGWSETGISLGSPQLTVAGTTLIAVDRNGEVSLIDLDTKTRLKITPLPTSADGLTTMLPVLIWGKVAVVASSEGAVWTFGGAASGDNAEITQATAESSATPETIAPVRVTMTDTGYTPDVIDLAPRTIARATFLVSNAGSKPHTFTVPELNIDVSLDPGKSTAITVPVTSGVFAVFSMTPGDIEAGLTGQVTIPTGLNNPVMTSMDWYAIYGVNTFVPNPVMTVRAQPSDEAGSLTTDSTTIIAISATAPGSTMYTTITVDGTEWMLVMTISHDVGWVKADQLKPIATPPAGSDQWPTPTIPPEPVSGTCPDTTGVVGPSAGLSQATLPMNDAQTTVLGWPAVPSGSYSLAGPANSVTTDQIDSAITSIFACAKISDDRVTPLLSGDYLQRVDALHLSAYKVRAAGNASGLVPIPPSALENPPGVRIGQPWLLADGRVQVGFDANGVGLDYETGIIGDYIYIFTRAGGRWYLDEAAPLQMPVIGASPEATIDPTRAAELKQGQFDTTPTTLQIQVDADGVLNGDPTAVAAAKAQLSEVLAPYAQVSTCQIGFISVSSKAGDDAQGTELSAKIVSLLSETEPGVVKPLANGDPGTLPNLAVADSDSTVPGTVTMDVYFFTGCTASAQPAATP